VQEDHQANHDVDQEAFGDVQKSLEVVGTSAVCLRDSDYGLVLELGNLLFGLVHDIDVVKEALQDDVAPIEKVRFQSEVKGLSVFDVERRFEWVLLIFVRGVRQINNAMNLGFMIFFVIFTAYESIYRRTGFLLIMYISVFVLA
jgi:hypothetical protein